jgi:hypothetical protein
MGVGVGVGVCVRILMYIYIRIFCYMCANRQRESVRADPQDGRGRPGETAQQGAAESDAHRRAHALRSHRRASSS